MDSVASALERSSISAIAAEKITSPSVMRNKHIKTMTSLTGVQLSQPYQTSRIGYEQEAQVVVGRNTTFMAGSNRLFKRQQELQHLQTQLDNEETRSGKTKPLPLNTLIFKTMSNLEELNQRQDTRVSQKESNSTVLLTKVKSQKKNLQRKDTEQIRKDSFSVEPARDSRQQLQTASALSTVEQVAPRTKICSKNAVALKKRRNNSTTEMSQLTSLIAQAKPKTQLISRLQMHNTSGNGTIKQTQIKLESSPKLSNLLASKQMSMFELTQGQTPASSYLIQKTSKNSTSAVSANTSKKTESSLVEVTNFSHASSKVVKNKALAKDAIDYMTQTTAASLGKTQSSAHRSNPKADRLPKKQEQKHVLTQDMTVQGRKGHHTSKNRTAVLGSCTNVQSTRQPSFVVEDETIYHAPGKQVSQSKKKEATNDEKSTRSNKKQRGQAKPGSTKESQSAVKTKLDKKTQDLNVSLSKTNQRVTARIQMSRNFKSTSQMESSELQQDGPPSSSHFVSANLTGTLTSRSSAAAGIGSKKEIKCVVTKQTKFDEERVQSLHKKQGDNFQDHLGTSLLQKKALKKYSSSGGDGSKSASKGKVTKCASAVMNQSKATPPTQPVINHLKKEKSKKKVQPNPLSESVDYKNKEKIQRRQMMQKIKNQLVSVFENQYRDSRLRNDSLRKVNSSAISDLGDGQPQSRYHDILRTHDDKISSPVLKSPPPLLNTPTKEPNPHKPKNQLKQSLASATKSYTISNFEPPRSDQKVGKFKLMPAVLGSARLNTSQPSLFDKVSPPGDFKMSSPHDKQHESDFPTEMSDHDDNSSNNMSDQSEYIKQSRGVILPKSVAKATKEKLKRYDFTLQLASQSGFKNQHSRNAMQGDTRFSQRFQRTLPNLALNDEISGLNRTPTSLKNCGKTQFKAKPQDRHTIYSDTHSVDMRYACKPTFSKPKNKDMRDNNQLQRNQPLSSPKTAQPVSILDDSPMEPDFIDQGKQVPAQGLYQDVKTKAFQKARVANQVSLLPQTIKGKESLESKVLSNSSDLFIDADSIEHRAGPVYDTADQASLTAKMGDVMSPPESFANVELPSQIKAFSLPKTLSKKSMSDKNQDSGNEDDSGFTNEAFSDSQFDDIADEDHLVHANQEQSPARIQIHSEKSQQFVSLPKHTGRPTISGKYTSCTEKHEAMQSSKRVPTVRVEISSYNESGQHLETAKEILSKKGSKCKCKITARDEDGRNKVICGNYCKNLSGRQQKKVVKKLMLDHFKTTINTAAKNGQKLPLGQRHNPFMNQANFGCLDDRKFLISASWWSKWCDYVNYTVDELGLTFPKESFRDTFLCDTNEECLDSEGDNPFVSVEPVDVEVNEQQDKVDQILKLSIFQQSSFATLEEAIENENDQSQIFYERPGCIENKDLLEPEVTYLNQVKRTVVEHFDYEVVPQSVWLHFYSWYSADVTICRRLVMDTMNIKGSQEAQMSQMQPPGMIGQPMHQQDSSYRQNQQYKVVLDLFPMKDNFQDDRQTQFLNRRRDIGYDISEEPESNDTTQLLYKKHIEDHSQTQTQIMQSDHDEGSTPEAQQYATNSSRGQQSIQAFNSQVARMKQPQTRITRNTLGVMMQPDDSLHI